jgi:regulator of protease activity HflC (stomatin/prohibitin superfamily)
MYFALGLVVVLIVLAASAIKVLREYERAVVFFFGRFQAVKGPGLILIIPVVQQMVRVDLRVRVFDVPPQDVISSRRSMRKPARGASRSPTSRSSRSISPSR